MTTTQSARRGARRLSRTTTLQVLTRGGFVGYGVFHLAVAWLALQIAFGQTGTEGDQSGAFRLLDRQPGGKVLLIVVTIGLIAMALWQLLLAALGSGGQQGQMSKGDRFVSACRVVIYGFLAYTAAKVVFGKSTSSAKQQQKTTAGVLGDPAGRWLVGLAGVVVVGVGIGMIIYGVRRSFEKRLLMGEMSHQTRRTVVALGVIGYVAKGVALGVAGVLVFDAALIDDAARSRGLDGALHTLVGEPFGPWLLGLVALGFVAYGIYCFWQAKYRKV